VIGYLFGGGLLPVDSRPLGDVAVVGVGQVRVGREALLPLVVGVSQVHEGQSGVLLGPH